MLRQPTGAEEGEQMVNQFIDLVKKQEQRAKEFLNEEDNGLMNWFNEIAINLTTNERENDKLLSKCYDSLDQTSKDYIAKIFIQEVIKAIDDKNQATRTQNNSLNNSLKKTDENPGHENPGHENPKHKKPRDKKPRNEFSKSRKSQQKSAEIKQAEKAMEAMETNDGEVDNGTMSMAGADAEKLKAANDVIETLDNRHKEKKEKFTNKYSFISSFSDRVS